MTPFETLRFLRDQAQRQLDGMTVNRDAFARDVLQLLDAVEAARARAASRRSAASTSAPDGSFSKAFGNIFDDIFGGHRP